MPEAGMDAETSTTLVLVIIKTLHFYRNLPVPARGPMGGCVMWYSPPTAIFRYRTLQSLYRFSPRTSGWASVDDTVYRTYKTVHRIVPCRAPFGNTTLAIDLL